MLKTACVHDTDETFVEYAAVRRDTDRHVRSLLISWVTLWALT
jgi:hypothetical protein